MIKSRFEVTVLYLLLCIIVFQPHDLTAKTGDAQLRSELAADSASLERAVRYLKNPDLKKKVAGLLDELMAQKRKIDYYPVDFYYSRGTKNNYTPNPGISLTIDQLADSLQSAVDLAKILRINKIDFFRFLMVDSSGAANSSFYSTSQDNHFVELDSFPVYRQQEFLKQIFLETVSSTDKKRSLEFIWGRSEDNDAFYSTRLTAFNGQFSVYPRYRTYIGLDTFRDKKAWFYDLAVYRKPQYLDTLTLSGRQLSQAAPVSIVQIAQNPIAQDRIDTAVTATAAVQPVITQTQQSVEPKIDNNLRKSFAVACYDKQKGAESYQLRYEANLNSNVIYDSLKNNLNSALYLKIEKNSTAIQTRLASEGLEVMAVDGRSNHARLNLILAAIENNPDSRHSVEWITGRSAGGSTYYATVITAFDGQLTVFNNYKKIADRSVIKDKNSWYNKLPVYTPQ